MKLINVVPVFQVCVVVSCCIPQDFGNDGTVCVCTASYCDTIPAPHPPNPEQFIMYTTNKAGLRFRKVVGEFNQKSDVFGNKVMVDVNKHYQKIVGWGGAFTDSTGVNIHTMNPGLRKHFMHAYFGDDGLEYSVCRVPIAGTDFSTRAYTYHDDFGDESLTEFNLTREDFDFKIPFIKEAMLLRNNSLRLIASAWSAPPWMKTNHDYSSFSSLGFLSKRFYQTWADYHLRFFEAYRTEGIEFWGVTTGNEPLLAYVPFVFINSLAWTPVAQSNWVSKNFGPTIRKSEFKNLKIIANDDQRSNLPLLVMLLLTNNETRNYIDGIAIHWYLNGFSPAGVLDIAHSFAPEKFILGTEACNGLSPLEKKVALGSWRRGEIYAEDILEDLNHWVSGWLDWNMVLDIQGGPSYVNNYVDSPIIVNTRAQEFYKQPMYYTLGHFAKFVHPLSVRVRTTVQLEKDESIEVVAFLRPDNATCVIIYNKGESLNITLYDERKGFLQTTITKSSINTLLYW